MSTQLDDLFGTHTFNLNSLNTAPGLDKFLALVKSNGLATHNNYFVVIDIPPLLYSKYSLYGETLSLLCSGGEFPAVNMRSTDLFFQGATKPMATHINYGEMFLFFYLEQDMSLKSFFDDWFNIIVNPVNGIVGYNDDYATNMRIYQLDKQYVPVYGIQLENVWPKATYPLQISYQGSQVHRLPISFTYRHWQNIEIMYNGSDASGFWGNLLSSQGMQLLNKIAPVIYSILMKG